MFSCGCHCPRCSSAYLAANCCFGWVRRHDRLLDFGRIIPAIGSVEGCKGLCCTHSKGNRLGLVGMMPWPWQRVCCLLLPCLCHDGSLSPARCTHLKIALCIMRSLQGLVNLQKLECYLYRRNRCIGRHLIHKTRIRSGKSWLMVLGKGAKTYLALDDMASICPRGAMYNDTSSAFSIKAFYRLARLSSPRRLLRQ